MKKVLRIGTVVLGVGLAVYAPGWAAPLAQGRAVISYPTDGLVLSGVVSIMGTATHPNIFSYQLRYAPGPQPTADSQWTDIAVVQGTQVDNGVLAQWDTTNLPNGQYTLALAVWGQDDPANPYLYFIRNLTVNNAAVPATPTPEETPTPTAEPLPTAVLGPTPTPVSVEQPPTATPLPVPTVASGVGAEETSTPRGDDVRNRPRVTFNMSEIGNAFCTGALLSILLLMLWGLYLLVKATVRYMLRLRRRPPTL